jgi:hypothetical protein
MGRTTVLCEKSAALVAGLFETTIATATTVQLLTAVDNRLSL